MKEINGRFVSEHKRIRHDFVVRITCTDGSVPDSVIPQQRARYDVRVFHKDTPRVAIHTDVCFAPRIITEAIDSAATLDRIADSAATEAASSGGAL
jgi:hypothetical protein